MAVRQSIQNNRDRESGVVAASSFSSDSILRDWRELSVSEYLAYFEGVRSCLDLTCDFAEENEGKMMADWYMLDMTRMPANSWRSASWIC